MAYTQLWDITFIIIYKLFYITDVYKWGGGISIYNCDCLQMNAGYYYMKDLLGISRVRPGV